MEKAFKLAYKWHTGHVRKKTTIPYISHLMAVSALVLEHGGTQKQAEAALLHDILEDTPCTYEIVKRKVGKKVADIVQACTHVENDGEKSLANWKARKQIYLDHLVEADHNHDAILVALADKTHNAEATFRDWVRHDRNNDWFGSVFNAPFEYQQWWYHGLLDAFKHLPVPQTLLARFEFVVVEMFGKPS
ncbi:MAG: HD domain-containing protein [Actinomycetes bacterium]